VKRDIILVEPLPANARGLVITIHTCKGLVVRLGCRGGEVLTYV
jgi:hypothetical protein